MQAPISYPVLTPSSHNYVVDDNHYVLYLDCPLPNFSIQEPTRGFSARLILNNPHPYIPGIHYVVEHTHSYIIDGNDANLYYRVCQDITMLTKILNTLPIQHHMACQILSKEIGRDMAIKAKIEQRSIYSAILSRPDFNIDDFPIINTLSQLPQQHL